MAVCAETTLLSEIYLPLTSGETMLEITDGDILDKIAWQWRAHQLTRNRFGKVSYPHCREVGLDLNVGSSEKQKLDLSSLTNSVMLDISDFSIDVGKSQILYICSILENNFNFGLENDQLYELYSSTLRLKLQCLMNIPNDTPEFLAAPFDLDINKLSQNDSSPETSRPQHVTTEPASPIKMDGTLCSDETVPSPAEGQSLTEPSTTETMRDLYPLCWEIGLDLRLKSKCLARQKLDPSLLTKGVMIEVANFTKYLCGLPKQIAFDLLKHNFGLDIENLELSDIFTDRLCQAKKKRKFLANGSSWKKAVYSEFSKKPFALVPRKKRKLSKDLEEANVAAPTESRRFNLKRKQKEQAKLKTKALFCQGRQESLQDVRRCTTSDSDIILRANAAIFGQENELSFLCPLEESDLECPLEESDLECPIQESDLECPLQESDLECPPGESDLLYLEESDLEDLVNEPATCLERDQQINMKTATSKTFVESENYEGELSFHIEPSSCISLVEIQNDFSLSPVETLACDREIKSEPTNKKDATQVPDIRVDNVSSTTTKEIEPLWHLHENGNADMIHMQKCDVPVRLEEEKRNSVENWRDTSCTQTTILSDINPPGTPSGETMSENTNSGTLDKTAWQWRAHQLTRNRSRRFTYPHCREVGLDFNAGSSKKQKLDLSSLTNAVMLDISDFSKDVSKAQIHFICSILENNFNLGLENGQLFDLHSPIVNVRIKRLRKTYNDTPEFLGALFDLPHANTLTQNDSFPETPGSQQVQTESAFPTKMDGPLCSDETMPRPSDGQSLTKTMRDLYPLCWEIGLDLRLKSECWEGQKLDLSLLTNGVMIEIANFIKYVCGVPKQVMFDLLKHNFDLDIENLELTDILIDRLYEAKTKRRSLPNGSSWKKALYREFQNEPFSLVPRNKKRTSGDLEEANAMFGQEKELAFLRPLEESDLEGWVNEPATCSENEQEMYMNTETSKTFVESENYEDEQTFHIEPRSCISLVEIQKDFSLLPVETVARDRQIKSEPTKKEGATQIPDIKVENVSSPLTANEREPLWYHNGNNNADMVHMQKCDVTMRLEEDKRNSVDIWRDTVCTQTTNLSDINLPVTSYGEAMLENTNSETLEETAWQWRAHQLTRNRSGKVTYPHCREIGIDFNAESNKKQKLDLSSLTNGVMLDISDFSRDVGKSQTYFIFSILQNNFNFGLENDQRNEFASRVMTKVKDLMKRKNDTSEFLNSLFDLPDLQTSNMSATLSWNDINVEHIKTEPASPTKMDGTLCSAETVPRPAEGQSLTEPSTTETKRDLYPLCWEIGLDLRLKSKCWPRQKLDPSLLTKGVMIEVANFTKHLCGVPRQIIFDLLKHNFDLDIENLELSDIFMDRLGQAKNKRKCLKRPLFIEFQLEPFSLAPRMKRKTSEGMEATDATASKCPRLKKVTESRRLDLKRKQEEQAKLKTRFHYQARQRHRQYVSRCTTSDNDILLRANAAMSVQERDLFFLRPLEESDLFCPLEESDLEGWVNEPATCSEPEQEINMNTETSKTFVESENYENELPFHIEPSSCISLAEIQKDSSLLPVEIVTCDREIQSDPTNKEGATQFQDIKVEYISSPPTTNEMEPLWYFNEDDNTDMVHMQKCDVTIKLEEDERNSPDIWRDTACTQTTILADINLPETPSGETMLENTNSDALDKIVWQWRTHQLTPNRSGKVTYPHCREVGLDFNVGSSKKQKLDFSSLTNGVMLDISDFSKDVGKAQMHFIFRILENNFHIVLENDQRFEFASRVMGKVKDLMKKKKDTPEFLGALFDLPDLNTRRTLSGNYSFSEASRPLYVKTEPASPTKIDGTLCMPWPAEGQTLTEPSTTETMRDLYPLCWEIGLDLGLKSKCWARQKLDLCLLTKGLMIEIAKFTKYLCGVPKQIMYDLLKHNFDLDIEKLELSDIFIARLCKAKQKREVLWKKANGSSWKKALYMEFQNMPFSLLAWKKRDFKVINAPASQCPRLKKVTESRRLDLKRKQEELAQLRIEDLKRKQEEQDKLKIEDLKKKQEEQDKLRMQNCEDKLPVLNEPWSCISLGHSYAKPYHQITNQILDSLPAETMTCDMEKKSELTNEDDATQALNIKMENVLFPSTSEIEPIWYINEGGKADTVYMQNCNINEKLEENNRNSEDNCTQTTRTSFREIKIQKETDINMKLEEDLITSVDIWRDTACAQITLLSDSLSLPRTPPGETMLENANGSDILDKTAWQWRAYVSTRCGLTRSTFPHCRKVGLDFNAGSSKKQKLDLSSLTNGVMLDIADFSKDVGKAQMHFIFSILENNFNLGLETEQQRYEFVGRFMARVKELMKKKKDTPKFLGALFDLPDLNTRTSSLSRNDSFPETFRSQHVKTDPASPTKMDGTLCDAETVLRHVEGRSLTEPSTTETMRDLYPFCSEIGLDLGLQSCSVGQKLDLSLLTNGVMIEVAHFIKHVCGVYRQIMFDLLRHNFDLDIENLNLTDIFMARLCEAKKKRKCLAHGSSMKKALFVEFQKKPFALVPRKKRKTSKDLEEANATASTESRRLNLKRKQKEQAKIKTKALYNCRGRPVIPQDVKRCTTSDSARFGQREELS